MILAALEKTGGNKTEAARQLGDHAQNAIGKTVALVLLAFDSAPADIFRQKQSSQWISVIKA